MESDQKISKYVAPMLLLICASACRHNDRNAARASDFSFTGTSGQYRGDATKVYQLVSMGFEHDGYKEDSFIKVWLEKHPNAHVEPLVVVTPKNRSQRQWIICRITDVHDTLNADLVRYGCLWGGQMLWDKNAPPFQPGLDRTKPEDSISVAIDSMAYQEYCNQIHNAGLYAREHKIGIWASGDWFQDTRAHFFGR